MAVLDVAWEDRVFDVFATSFDLWEKGILSVSLRAVSPKGNNRLCGMPSHLMAATYDWKVGLVLFVDQVIEFWACNALNHGSDADKARARYSFHASIIEDGNLGGADQFERARRRGQNR